MRGRYIAANIICSYLLLISGCVSFAPPITPKDNPDPDVAYLYGRFKQTKDSGVLRTQAGIVAIILEGTQPGNKYIIRFQWDNDVQGIPVKPGCYHVTEWKAIDCFGSETLISQILTEHVRNNNLCLEKGRAYYLGDFLVNCSHYSRGLTHTYGYVMKPPTNNFESTTEQFNSTYPTFSNLPKATLSQEKFFKDEFDKDHILIEEATINIVPVPVYVPPH
jgi:hypothetical protein